MIDYRQQLNAEYNELVGDLMRVLDGCEGPSAYAALRAVTALIAGRLKRLDAKAFGGMRAAADACDPDLEKHSEDFFARRAVP